MDKFTTLISASTLLSELEEPDLVVADCRFSLAEPERGQNDYEKAHIPGAIYAHLDHDLSSPVVKGVTGRHPLPDIDQFCRKLGDWGVRPGSQVVAYDDSGGGIAARLWWLLRWLGHDSVAVLDGGWPAWVAGNRPVRSVYETYPGRTFVGQPGSQVVVNSSDVERMIDVDGGLIIDSRASDRYRGENETIDPVAGHIPGAISAPYQDNLDANGFFLSQEELRARFLSILGNFPAGEAVFYCGSGVTAAHNLLALAHAGLGQARLYAGSWSEWITDPNRPVATG